MEENMNPIPEEPQVPVEPRFTAHGLEMIFGGVILLLSVLMCNFILYGGFHLGFGLVAGVAVICSWVYLSKSGRRFGGYEKTLLILSLLICLGFGRTNDGNAKFTMVLFLFAAVNLALCIGTGQNRRNPQGAMSLLDAPRAFYRMGFGNLGATGKGLATGIRYGGAATKRIGAVGVGLLVSAPILVIMVSLLMSADAAFEGLMDLLPEFALEEYILSALWGVLLAWILYSRGVSLAKESKPMAACRTDKGVNALTVNTVLSMVCLLYVVYLLSQLAYFSGGLSGILPEEFTMAEYARRGFFEMSWLSTMNLGLICFSIWLIRVEKLPRFTKITGAFLTVITLFLIVTASAKMFLYIASYGLTWSRVTTEVFMLWLAITTVLVAIRLFLPKFGYMKAVVLTAMVLGTLVFWVDVETLVVEYNVNAYRSGRLETVDVAYLDTMGAAAVPRLLELAEDENPEIAAQARDILDRKNRYTVEDFRGWNFTKARADKLLTEYHARQEQELLSEIQTLLGVDLSPGEILRNSGTQISWEDGKRYIEIDFDYFAGKEISGMLEEAGWNSLPLGVPLRVILNREADRFAEFRNFWLDDAKGDGFWIFRDLHPKAVDPADPEKVLTRSEYCFIVAYYNASRSELCIFQIDAPAEVADAK